MSKFRVAAAVAVTDIGVEQGAGDPLRGADFGHPSQRRHDRLYHGDVFLGKAAGLLRGPGRGMDGPVAEDERRGQVVGGARDRRFRGAGTIARAGRH